jgi:tetratricopeptide (TPR) repeat protein
MKRQNNVLLISISVSLLMVVGIILRERPTSIATIVQNAFAAANTFEYDRAISIATDAIIASEADGSSPRRRAELYTLRGQMIILTYEWDRALADYNTAIELDPTYPDAYFHRGLLYYTNYVQIEFERARADFVTYLQFASSGQYAPLARDYIADIDAQREALGDS